MTINAAFSNAVGGLRVASRGANIVSKNLAQGMQDGYGRRSLEVDTVVRGENAAGIGKIGEQRHADAGLIQRRRTAQGATTHFSVQSGALERLEQIFGNFDTAGSLSDRITKLETTLLEASNRPESQLRLRKVVDTAEGVAQSFRTLADAVRTERQTADQSINATVKELNGHLASIARLNREMAQSAGLQTDQHAIMDERQVILDRIAEIVPIRTMQRDSGQITVLTRSGEALVDINPAKIGFTPSGYIAADMTMASGALSGITINDKPMRSAHDLSSDHAGRLSGLVKLRDQTLVDVQGQLDALAYDFTARFQSNSVDPTLTPTDTGLFTDGGAQIDPANQVGLSARLQVNDLVRPDAGGSPRALRDGLQATTPRERSDGTVLQNMLNALTSERPTTDPALGRPRTASGHAAFVATNVANMRVSTQAEMASFKTTTDRLGDQMADQGTNNDEELQNLIVFENLYAANSKVIQALDQMFESILRI